MPVSTKKVDEAREAFRRRGGTFRTRDALKAGIHQRTLYAMRDAGLLDQLARGLFRLADEEPLSDPDLVTVAARIPRGVVCLISALSFHDITTQIPHAVDVAIARNAEPPRLSQPPIRVFRFSGPAFTAGIETHTIDGVAMRIYSAEKTLADCFKFRNRIGQESVIEALRLYRERRRMQVEDLLRYADVCRVRATMQPYLEALL